MNLIPLLIATLVSCPFQTESTIVAQEILTTAHDDGQYLLKNRFKGKLTQQYSDLADVGLPFADAEHEFTHVKYSTLTEGGKDRQHAWINGQKTGADIPLRSSSTSLQVKRSIPSFDVLKQLKRIEGFERELGPLRKAFSLHVSNGVPRSSLHWSGCMVDDDGNLRGVDVFLHIVDFGSGWEIEHRHVYEGIFRPIENGTRIGK